MKKLYYLNFLNWLAVFLLGCISTNVYGQCTISISKVTVSGCYLVGSQSKATVSVEVAWWSVLGVSNLIVFDDPWLLHIP